MYQCGVYMHVPVSVCECGVYVMGCVCVCVCLLCRGYLGQKEASGEVTPLGSWMVAAPDSKARQSN